jgi:peroxiredoxin Q/BCP
MALKIHDPAPDFELPADDGSPVRLSDLRGKKVILYFYPRADTPGCTIEACEFRDLTPRIDERNATVLGVSPDPVEDVRKFREKFALPFRLLADADHEVAEAYDVWKERTIFGKTMMGAERTTYVIDEKGKIADVFEKVSAEGHASQVLERL